MTALNDNDLLTLTMQLSFARIAPEEIPQRAPSFEPTLNHEGSLPQQATHLSAFAANSRLARGARGTNNLERRWLG